MKNKNLSTKSDAIDTKSLPHIGRQHLADYYRKLSDSVYNDSVDGTPNGTFCYGFSDPVFPDPTKTHDLKGKQVSNNFGMQSQKEKAMMVLTHSEYDLHPDPSVKYYELDFTLYQVNHVTAGGQRGTAHNEWYLDHSGGFRQSETSTIEKTSVVSNPTRSNNASTSDGGSFRLDHHYPTLRCYPKGMAGIVTKGFEKDTTKPDSIFLPLFETGLRDWIELFYDLGKAVATKRFGAFAVDVISMIAKAILSNTDDPMNPSVTVISGGACRFILENCQDGNLSFGRRVLGQKGYLARVDDAPADWGSNPYVQIVQYEDTRSYQLDFVVKVRAVR